MTLYNIPVTFASGHAVWLLPLWVCFVALIWYRWCIQRAIVRYIAHPDHIAIVLPRFSYVRLTMKAVVWTSAILGLALAALQPQWGKKEEKVTHIGRDLFVALDISRSMLAQDDTPDRLTAAKNKIKEIARLLKAERIGLIVFASGAFVQCPLTTDHTAFNLFLDAIDVETIAGGSTALDEALMVAIKAFGRHTDTEQRLLVIVTDGEDFSSSLERMREQAQEAGITVCALGMGSDHGAPIPVFDEYNRPNGHIVDHNGNVVISKLNEPLLRELAHALHGFYIRSTADNGDVNAIVQWVQKHEQRRLEEMQVVLLHERYPYAIAVTLLCLLIEWIL